MEENEKKDTKDEIEELDDGALGNVSGGRTSDDSSLVEANNGEGCQGNCGCG